METKIRTDLLRQLADHLLNGKLGHEEFYFGSFNTIAINIENTCGTKGCAAGECPIIWPDQWRFAKNRTVRLINNPIPSNTDVWLDLGHFFGLTPEMVLHLFVPSEGDEDGGFTEVYQIEDTFGGEILEYNATKEEVAKNIIIFCDKADKGDFTI